MQVFCGNGSAPESTGKLCLRMCAQACGTSLYLRLHARTCVLLAASPHEVHHTTFFAFATSIWFAHCAMSCACKQRSIWSDPRCGWLTCLRIEPAQIASRACAFQGSTLGKQLEHRSGCNCRPGVCVAAYTVPLPVHRLPSWAASLRPGNVLQSASDSC